MDFRALLLIATAALLLGGCSRSAEKTDEIYYYGAWMAIHGSDGFLTKRGEDQMSHVREVGFGWVAYAPEPTMEDVTQPTITDSSSLEHHRQVIRRLKAKGLRVLLFPRIESPTFFRAKDPLWRGDIKMTSPEDWAKFHDNLGTVLEKYAGLAEEEEVGLFCLGLEYRHSTVDFPNAWRKIAKRVRAKYTGKVTYSANWYREYEQVKFWDALDYIGIGAYFPVADQPKASRQSMRAAWLGIQARLRGLSQLHNRKIIFTEVGYPAFDQAGWKPWEWTTKANKSIDYKHQADCYRAFLDAFDKKDWFQGFFVWRYHTDTRYIEDWEYCPQGHEAESVLNERMCSTK
ncbi:MAG: hypothetical protein ACI97A_003085 [Planctomycetota bacterium]